MGAAYILKGRETGDLANYVLGRQTFEDAVKTDPTDIAARSQLAAAHTVFHDFPAALKQAEAVVKEDPTAADAWGVIADSHLELGHYKQCLEAAQRMIDLKPNLGSYSRGAQVRWAFGDPRGATFLYLKAIEAGGSHESLAWARVQLGDVYFKTGSYTAAKQQYEKALATLPDYRHATAGLARIRLAEGRSDEAVRLMKEAVAIGPSVAMLTDLALMHRSTGRVADAAKVEAQIEPLVARHMALGIGGDEPALARYYLLSGTKKDEALRLMEAEVKEHTSVQVYATLAWAQLANGQKDGAVANVAKALEFGTKEPWVLKRCAEILSACGQTERAKALAPQAKAVCPSPSAWTLL